MPATHNHELGRLGERLAAEHCVRLGYRVLARNHHTRWGELDLVLTDGATLVFCEVKTRVSGGSPGPFGPLTAIGGRKRRQLRRMARQWLAARSASGGPPASRVRFDAIGVTLNRVGRLITLEHLEDAF